MSEQVDKILKNDPKEAKPAFEVNHKQRKFVEKILTEGLTPTDAYLAVYNCKSRDSANKASSRLLKKGPIQDLLLGLSSQLKSMAHMPKHLVLLKLKQFTERCEKEDNKKYFIEGMTLLCKILGYTSPSQTQPPIQLSQSISFGSFEPTPIQIPPIQSQTPSSQLLEDDKIDDVVEEEGEDGDEGLRED